MMPDMHLCQCSPSVLQQRHYSSDKCSYYCYFDTATSSMRLLLWAL